MRVTRYIGFDRAQRYEAGIEMPRWLEAPCDFEPRLAVPLLPFFVGFYAQAYLRRALIPRITVYLQISGPQWTLLAPPASSRDERRYERLNLGAEDHFLSNEQTPMQIITTGQTFRLPTRWRRYQAFDDAISDSNAGAYRTPSKRPGDVVAFDLPNQRPPRGGPKARLTYSDTTLQLTCGDETHALDIAPRPSAVFSEGDDLALDAWLQRELDTNVAMHERDQAIFARLTFEGMPIEIHPCAMENFELEVRTQVDEKRRLRMSRQGTMQNALREHGYGTRTGDNLFDRTWWVRGDPISVKALADHCRLRDAAPWRIRSGWLSSPARREQLLRKISVVAELARILNEQ